jgi:hypothetical protein
MSRLALVGFCRAFVIFQLELLTQRTLDGTITCFVGVASLTENRGYANAQEVANH